MVLLAPVAFAQTRINESVTHPDLRAVILLMEEVDQEVRKELTARGFGNLDSLDMVRQQAVDETNTRILAKIIEDYGWPTPKMIGEDGMDAVFLLVQHAEQEFQKRMLPFVKASFERGEIHGGHYALLLDRTRVNDGLSQVYGSQAKIENGILRLYPIEYKSDVDVRRTSLGLEPLEDYIQSLEKLYGARYLGQ